MPQYYLNRKTGEVRMHTPYTIHPIDEFEKLNVSDITFRLVNGLPALEVGVTTDGNGNLIVAGAEVAPVAPDDFVGPPAPAKLGKKGKKDATPADEGFTFLEEVPTPAE